MLATGKGRIYMAPWAERRADGALVEYGPAPSTFARHVARHKDWSWRKPRKGRGHLADAEQVLALLASDAHIPERERQTGSLIYEHHLSQRDVAERLGIARATVRTYIDRLRERACEIT